MLRLLGLWFALLSFATAQQNYKPTTGTRSLWIPFKTINGVPRASVLGRDSQNHTTYVVSCPTGQAQCGIQPNLTVTAGIDFVAYTSSTSGATSGTVEVKCPALTASPVVCSQIAHGGGNIQKTSGTIAASEIVYSAIDVTALKQQTTGPKTVTVAPTTSSTTSSSSTGGVETMTSGPFAMAGAIGAGLLAFAAL